MSYKYILFTSAACIFGIFASPANAEEADSRKTKAESEAVEIGVTAQKRAENLQEVPLSISVVTGKDLLSKGAAQLTDFSGYIPGLQVDTAGSPGQSTISLRGIGPLGPSATVGTYLDEAPVGSSSVYARSAVFNLDLLPYDVQRIEVLRGPQGTLYGASSIGGVLKYVTVEPSLDAFEGKAGGEIFGIKGSSNVGYAAQAFLNVPLAQDMAGLTFSYARRKSPGFIDNVETGARDQNPVLQQGARIALRLEPTERLSIVASGIWQNIESANNALVVERISDGQRLGDGLSNNNYLDEPFSKDFYWGALSADLDLDFATLSSATTYSHNVTRQTNDASRVFGVIFPFFGAPGAGLSQFDIRLELKKFTQEIRLASASDDRFEWLIGGFFTDEKSENKQNVSALTFAKQPIAGLDPFAIAALPSTYREYSVFGNATFKFSPKFDISGGLRWARNDQKFRQISGGAILPAANQGGTSSEEVITFSAGPRWRPNDDVMVYLRAASGYRPGGPNVILPNVPPIVDSDRLTNYEFGVKAELFDKSVTFDAALFRMDWKDIQLSVDFNGVSGGANAGRARSQGLEAALIWRATPKLVFGLNGAYTDAKLTEDTPPSVGGKKGDRLPRIPEFSGSATADYAFPIGDDVDATLGLGVRYVGSRISGAESTPQATIAKAYTAVDVNSVFAISDRFTVRLYARNLLDSKGALSRDRGRDGIGQPTFFFVAPMQPRTVGAAIELAF